MEREKCLKRIFVEVAKLGPCEDVNANEKNSDASQEEQDEENGNQTTVAPEVIEYKLEEEGKIHDALSFIGLESLINFSAADGFVISCSFSGLKKKRARRS